MPSRTIRARMTGRRSVATASTAVAMAVAATVVASTSASAADSVRQTATDRTPTMSRVAARERPRGGVVEDCSPSPSGGGSLAFTSRWNLVVGPLALKGAGVMLGYAEQVGGNKLFVYVKGGHRVTLELSRQTRRGAGLAFGRSPSANVLLRHTRRIVTFIACRRGELSGLFDGWPVTGWVGFLLASSPRCVPLLVWVDDEPSPRRAVIRFGVRTCE